MYSKGQFNDDRGICTMRTRQEWMKYKKIRVKPTCSGLWNISMNGYSFRCLSIQKPGYFGHSTWKSPIQEPKIGGTKCQGCKGEVEKLPI